MFMDRLKIKEQRVLQYLHQFMAEKIESKQSTRTESDGLMMNISKIFEDESDKGQKNEDG